VVAEEQKEALAKTVIVIIIQLVQMVVHQQF
jgi:hypothetical protein